MGLDDGGQKGGKNFTKFGKVYRYYIPNAWVI